MALLCGMLYVIKLLIVLVSEGTDGSTRRQSADFVLGVIPRHCILHALTVIKEALYKVSSVCILE